MSVSAQNVRHIARIAVRRTGRDRGVVMPGSAAASIFCNINETILPIRCQCYDVVLRFNSHVGSSSTGGTAVRRGAPLISR